MPSCNEAITKKVEQLVLTGVPPKVAAEANGINGAEFVSWMRRGEAGKRGHANFRKFWQAVVAAEAECEAGLVKQVSTRSPRWQAAVWLLERRWPERYGKKSITAKGDPKAPGAPGVADPFSEVDNVVELASVK